MLHTDAQRGRRLLDEPKGHELGRRLTLHSQVLDIKSKNDRVCDERSIESEHSTRARRAAAVDYDAIIHAL